MVERLRYLRPSTEIRQTMQYSDYGYWVLAEVMVRLTRQPVPSFVQTHLLDPLNMTTTKFNHTEAKETGNLAGGYGRVGIDRRECGRIWKEQGKADCSCYGRPLATEWFVKGDGMWTSRYCDLVRRYGKWYMPQSGYEC